MTAVSAFEKGDMLTKRAEDHWHGQRVCPQAGLGYTKALCMERPRRWHQSAAKAAAAKKYESVQDTRAHHVLPHTHAENGRMRLVEGQGIRWVLGSVRESALRDVRVAEHVLESVLIV